MRTVLVYAPFCTPAAPPYAIANIASFLRANLPEGQEVRVLDINLLFHAAMFSEEQAYYQGLKEDYSHDVYDSRTAEFRRRTEEVYRINNRKVVEGKVPELFEDMLGKILAEKPDLVAFSIVYSSQAFYACALIGALKARGIRCVVGGPSAAGKVKSAADVFLRNEVELLDYITGKKSDHEKLVCGYTIDFKAFPLEDYFVPSPVIPIKTSSTCYYQQCAFCTHHGKGMYYVYDLAQIGRTVAASGAKHVFIVDDMVSGRRLMDIAKVFRPLGVKWTVQLKPTRDFDLAMLKALRSSGLRMIIWGVESGCDRILGLMKKGTNRQDISKVLAASHAAGIKNSVYIMFGFPTETKEEFLETIQFLKDNADSIDLISTSVFGLQKGAPVFESASDFGITEITETGRTVLEPSIKYKVSSGLSREDAEKLRNGYKRTIENINKYPKLMNFFREHMLCLEK
ncbi:radical SAM protein [Candidatus Woesearchaeota archaeon]|nr:radical SAM protein [Candidatus Woesearchaeota archaeon]